jgi:hypothetical protein
MPDIQRRARGAAKTISPDRTWRRNVRQTRGAV